jgi:arsenate reductase (glutaredoxin)
MKATIWHNPRCSKSRAALDVLQQRGYAVEVIEYLKHPPSVETLTRLYQAAGINPAQGLRLSGTNAAEQGLPTADDATVLAAMAADPALIERPLVETAKGVRLCRPEQRLLDII